MPAVDEVNEPATIYQQTHRKRGRKRRRERIDRGEEGKREHTLCDMAAC